MKNVARLLGVSKNAIYRWVADKKIPAYRVGDQMRIREEMTSTGVGNGIAISHPRSPLLLHVDEPSVTLCMLEQSVDFGALDGIPVFALLTILSSTARAHLHLLARIAFALRAPDVQAALQDRASRETLLYEIRGVEADLLPPLRFSGGEGRGVKVLLACLPAFETPAARNRADQGQHASRPPEDLRGCDRR